MSARDRPDTQGFTTLALATPLFTLALGAATPTAGPSDGWVLASVDASCNLTDVDFSDRLHGFATCAFGDAMTTDDGGFTWTLFSTGLRQSLMFARAASKDEFYAARLGLYRSVDRGQHWEELGSLTDNPGYTVFDVHFGDAGHLVAVQGGMLLSSEDGGAHWNLRYPETQDIYLFELDFPSESIGYASGGISYEGASVGSFLRTGDGGLQWSQLPFTHGEITATDFFDDDHGVVATLPGELYSTADGGDSWTRIGPAPDGSILLDITHRDAAHWYAVSLQGCLYETYNAGVEWETGYCDRKGNALTTITLRSGSAVAGGSGGVVVVENRRIFTDSFESE